MGVSLHTKEACPGLNLYNTRANNKIFLIDNSGKVYKTWINPKGAVHNSKLDSDLNLYSIVKGKKYGFVKIDSQNNLIWQSPITSHHDLDFVDDSTLITFDRSRKRWIRFKNKRINSTFDDLVLVDRGTGQVTKRFIIYKQILKAISKQKVNINNLIEPSVEGLFHFNSIQILNHNIDTVAKKGDILILSRNLGQLFIIDHKTNRLIWSWAIPEIDNPHSPVVLKNGTILILDNGKKRNKDSKILELDLKMKKATREIIAPIPFFTKYQGGVQFFDNGNILVTVAGKGTAFEFTKSGKIVWEFTNKDNDIHGNTDEIFKLSRYSYQFFKNLD